jgi:hypothetical protein
MAGALALFGVKVDQRIGRIGHDQKTVVGGSVQPGFDLRGDVEDDV